MSAIETLLQTLISLGATLRPPAGDAQITAAEKTLSCEFPEGVREFYRRCDGTGETASRWMWDFFSLGQVIESTIDRRKHSHLLLGSGETIPYAHLVCFCDVLIDAPAYAFCGNPRDPRFGCFYADPGAEGWLVAASFEDFIRIFLDQHDETLLNA